MPAPRIFLTACCFLALAPILHAADAAPVRGVLIGVSKAENSDTGSINVNVAGSQPRVATFQVNSDTVFEKVVGTVHHKSSFLVEHRGENVVVVPKADKSDVAARVEVLFELKPFHVHGVVVDIKKDALTVVIHHQYTHGKKPPPDPAPVEGTITDVTKDQDQPTGSLTLKVHEAKGDTSTRFIINPGTSFVVVRGQEHRPGSFLKEHVGEKALVYPSNWHPLVARQVDVLLAADSPPKIEKPKDKPKAKPNDKPAKQPPATDHTATMTLTSSTTYELVREKEHRPAAFAALALGENVEIISLPDSHQVAARVEIQLPHLVHGVVEGKSGTTFVLRVHHGDRKSGGKVVAPAHDELLAYAVNDQTKFETVEKKQHKPAVWANLVLGDQVNVFGQALPQLPVELVEITGHARGTAKVQKYHGIVIEKGAVEFVVKAHIPEKKEGGKIVTPAVDTLVKIAVDNGTQFEVVNGKERVAATFALVLPGEEVNVSTKPGSTELADKVEIHPAKKPKK